MVDIRDPWVVLGIPPTDDERAVKRAYAAKLRLTRPEDDPAGFQELVEARDLALLLRGPLYRDDDDFEEPSAPDEEVEESGNPDVPDVPDGPDVPEDEAQGSDPVRDDDHDDHYDADRIVSAIAAFLNSEVQDSHQAEAAMKKIGELSLDARSEVEPDLLQAVADYLEVAGRVARGSYDEGNRRYLQRVMILDLDEEFGWSRNDRQLYNIIGSDAFNTIDALQRLRNPSYNPQTIDSTATKSGWTFKWRWSYWIVVFFLIKMLSTCVPSNRPDIILPGG